MMKIVSYFALYFVGCNVLLLVLTYFFTEHIGVFWGIYFFLYPFLSFALIAVSGFRLSQKVKTNHPDIYNKYKDYRTFFGLSLLDIKIFKVKDLQFSEYEKQMLALYQLSLNHFIFLFFVIIAQLIIQVHLGIL